jgi:hypothetical protein
VNLEGCAIRLCKFQKAQEKQRDSGRELQKNATENVVFYT